jgi:Sulfotransferase domain
MWSGPRNVSTAFMRSWENRPDTIVVDEPFYAHYLAVTGLDHPGRDEILAHHERDWRRVVESLLAPLPPGVEVLYQKQMSHHLLPDMGREWLASMTHAFLIRDPAPMLASLEEKLGRFDLDATGLPQQVEIFDFVVRTTGRVPPVVDSADLLAAPEPMLRALCAALDIPFTPRMLSWPVGPRASDGIWARHWYERVERSTGFEPAAATEVPDLQGRLAELEGRCRPLYEKLRAHRLRA